MSFAACPPTWTAKDAVSLQLEGQSTNIGIACATSSLSDGSRHRSSRRREFRRLSKQRRLRVKSFTSVAVVALWIAAALLWLPAALGWEITVNGFLIPNWVNVIACVVTATLAVMLSRQMRTFPNNCLEWSRLRVGTPPRFWLQVTSMTLFQFLIIYIAATRGWQLALAWVTPLCWGQFQFIYALRLLVLRTNSASSPRNVA